MRNGNLNILWLASREFIGFSTNHIDSIIDIWPNTIIKRVCFAHDALNMIEQGDIDILIMDPWIPEGHSCGKRKDFSSIQMDIGIEIVQRLRDSECNIPIIAYSLPVDDSRITPLEVQGVKVFTGVLGVDELHDAIREMKQAIEQQH